MGKRQTLFLMFLILAQALCAPAQDSGRSKDETVVVVHPAKKLQQTQEEYRTAIQDWTAATTDLEKDAFDHPSKEVADRIDKAERLRDKLSEKRLQYYDTVTGVYQDRLKKLSASGPGPDPTQSTSIMKDQVKGDLLAVDQEIRDVQQELNQIGNDPKQSDLRLTLKSELLDLEKQQTAYLKMQHDWDTLTDNAEIQKSRANMLRTYQSLISIFQLQKSKTEDAAKYWDDYYESLKKTASKPSAPEVKAGDVGETKVAVRIPTSPVAPTPQAAPTGDPLSPTAPPITQPTSFAGTWVYVRGSLNQSAYPPLEIRLQITDLDGEITGNFFGKYQAPKGSPIKQPVSFDFHGKRADSEITGGDQLKFSFRTQDGWTGHVILTLQNVPPDKWLTANWVAEVDPKPIVFEDALKLSPAAK
jgi:hypothetical protein